MSNPAGGADDRSFEELRRAMREELRRQNNRGYQDFKDRRRDEAAGRILRRQAGFERQHAENSVTNELARAERREGREGAHPTNPREPKKPSKVRRISIPEDRQVVMPPPPQAAGVGLNHGGLNLNPNNEERPSNEGRAPYPLSENSLSPAQKLEWGNRIDKTLTFAQWSQRIKSGDRSLTFDQWLKRKDKKSDQLRKAADAPQQPQAGEVLQLVRFNLQKVIDRMGWGEALVIDDPMVIIEVTIDPAASRLYRTQAEGWLGHFQRRAEEHLRKYLTEDMQKIFVGHRSGAEWVRTEEQLRERISWLTGSLSRDLQIYANEKIRENKDLKDGLRKTKVYAGFKMFRTTVGLGGMAAGAVAAGGVAPAMVINACRQLMEVPSSVFELFAPMEAYRALVEKQVRFLVSEYRNRLAKEELKLKEIARGRGRLKSIGGPEELIKHAINTVLGAHIIPEAAKTRSNNKEFHERINELFGKRYLKLEGALQGLDQTKRWLKEVSKNAAYPPTVHEKAHDELTQMEDLWTELDGLCRRADDVVTKANNLHDRFLDVLNAIKAKEPRWLQAAKEVEDVCTNGGFAFAGGAPNVQAVEGVLALVNTLGMQAEGAIERRSRAMRSR